MQGLSRQPVYHTNSEGREGILARRLSDEEAQGLLHEGVERLFGREVCLVARDRRPEERRGVHYVVPRRTLHRGELRSHLVTNTLELLPVIAPRKDVAVRPYGFQSEAVGLIEVTLDPFAVDLVGPGVAGEREHVAGLLLKTLQVLRRIVDKEVLIYNVVTGKQHADWRCEREAAVRTVGGIALVSVVRGDHSR